MGNVRKMRLKPGVTRKPDAGMARLYLERFLASSAEAREYMFKGAMLINGLLEEPGDEATEEEIALSEELARVGDLLTSTETLMGLAETMTRLALEKTSE